MDAGPVPLLILAVLVWHDHTCIASTTCPGDKFTCEDNGECIDPDLVCNGYNSCPRGTDEDPDFCTSWTCTNDRFKCEEDRKCILQSWVCDGRRKCSQGSDEDPDLCNSRTCPRDYFACGSGQCVHQCFVCDGDWDCVQGSDEDSDLCTSWTCCSLSRFKCVEDRKCIPQSWLCNGYSFCSQGADEDPDLCNCRASCPNIESCHTNNGTCLCPAGFTGPDCMTESALGSASAVSRSVPIGTGAIAGSVVAGVVIVGLLVFLIIRRRRSAARRDGDGGARTGANSVGDQATGGADSHPMVPQPGANAATANINVSANVNVSANQPLYSRVDYAAMGEAPACRPAHCLKVI